ncbi:MAG: hypothetical protein ABI416_04970, partial [Ginsengibacter sp.]
ILDYIHQHSAAAGFVSKPEDWKYSSSGDFCGMKGLSDLSDSWYSVAQVLPEKAQSRTCSKPGIAMV